MTKNALFLLLGLTINASTAYCQNTDSSEKDSRESIIDKFQSELRELERVHNEKLDLARKGTVGKLQLLRKAIAAWPKLRSSGHLIATVAIRGTYCDQSQYYRQSEKGRFGSERLSYAGSR